jgi:putative oxygen-independent coproporphyrinogen III oxidase
MLKTPPLGLYVHIPWCVRKCPYCDFNSHAAGTSIPEKAYVAALLADLEQDLPKVSGRTVETIFIGGGTPSLFGPEAIADLLAGIGQRLPLAPDLEVTLEANPGTVESGKFRAFRQAGVNRLSIGIQSFSDRHLQALGRIHGSAEATRAAEIAREAGFSNVNLDLMFGLPDQNPRQASADVRTALALNPAHVSLYQLTLEPNTSFFRHPPTLPRDDDIWAMQQACQALLAEGGFVQYEVSAYARAGFRCRHNQNYWRFGDYLGIGAGAHGKLTDTTAQAVTRSWKVRHPLRYLESAGRPQCIGASEAVQRRDLPIEFLMNQLRLREGFAEGTFSERTGLPFEDLEPGLSDCVEAGLIERREGSVRCTDIGWNFLDNVLERFVQSDG